MTDLVKAVYGDLVLRPTSATTGGTTLTGLDPDQPIRLIIPHGVVTRRHGFKRDAVRSRAKAVAPAAMLMCPAMGGDVETTKLLFAAHSLDGQGIVSRGVNALLAGRQPVAVPAVIRPRDATEDYIYFPALQLFEDADPLVNRSPVAFHELAESSLILLPGSVELSDVAAITVGTSSDVDAAIEEASGEGMAYITKKITVAQLVALGAATSGRIAMDDAIPAGAVPLAFTARNRGTAFTSSGGSVTQLDASIVATGQTADALVGSEVGSLMTAGRRGGQTLGRSAVAASVAPWPNGAWTPEVYFECNQNLSTLEGGDDGIEIIIVYQNVTLPS